MLAALGGVLHFLGFVGFGIWPLALICLVPLWVGLDAARRRVGVAAALGFVFGWVSYAGGYLWLWRIVDVFLSGNAWLGAAVWGLDGTWFALRYALYAVLFCLLRRRGRSAALAGVPSLLVIEWAYPMLFPVYLGHALAERLPLIQIADLGGPLLLTALVALCNAAAFELWRRWRHGVWRPAAVAAAALAVALACAYGWLRMAQLAAAVARAPATLRVGIVQGNLGVQEKGVRAARDHQRYLEQTRELLAAGPLDLVVWPETVYTRGLRGPLPIAGDLIRQELPVALLFGGAYVDPATAPPRTYNAALLVDRAGIVRSAYRKRLLIPFTEYVPFAALWPGLAARFASASHFSAADEVDVAADTVRLDHWAIATPICYEAVRPGLVRRLVREPHAALIVTLANDAWFGDSQEPALHLAMARMRAVELRRFLVRATNSGISAVVDPTGRELVRSALLTRANLRATVALLEETTLYARCGDWPGGLALMILLLAMAGARSRRGRARSPAGCPDGAAG